MKYKVGDTVLIRRWDDMEKEFGLDEYGNILCKMPFYRTMRRYCETIREIVDIDERKNYYKLNDGGGFEYIDDMIERKITMLKEDLKTGYIITLRNGTECVVFKDVGTTCTNLHDSVLINYKANCWINLNGYDNNLKHFDSRYDIMKVEQPINPYSIQDMDYGKDKRILLWKRKEPKEMTMDEIEKTLGYPVKIVGI